MAALTMKNSDISSNSMDSLGVRREARRRKILENAESRLKKLTGVEQKSNLAIDDFRPINYGDNHLHSAETENYLPHNGISPSSPIESSNVASNVSSVSNQNNYKERAAILQQNDHKTYTLLGIALIANVLVIFSNINSVETVSDDGCSMIFIPFFGYKLLDFFMNRNNIHENSILQLLLMMNFRSNTLKRGLIYIQHLTHFTQDLFVYFFVFIVINQFFRMIFWLR